MVPDPSSKGRYKTKELSSVTKSRNWVSAELAPVDAPPLVVAAPAGMLILLTAG